MNDNPNDEIKNVEEKNTKDDSIMIGQMLHKSDLTISTVDSNLKYFCINDAKSNDEEMKSETKTNEKAKTTTIDYIHSQGADFAVDIIFKNESNDKIYIYWIDYNGILVKQGSIDAIFKPNKKDKEKEKDNKDKNNNEKNDMSIKNEKSIHSYVTHPFLFSKENDINDIDSIYEQLIGIYIAQNGLISKQKLTIAANGCLVEYCIVVVLFGMFFFSLFFLYCLCCCIRNRSYCSFHDHITPTI